MNNLMKLIILISITILGNSLSIKSHQNKEHIYPNSQPELAPEKVSAAENLNDDLFIGTGSYIDFLESVLSNHNEGIKHVKIKDKDWLKKDGSDSVMKLDGTRGYITKDKELAPQPCYVVNRQIPEASVVTMKYASSLSSKDLNNTLQAGIGFKSDFTVAPKKKDAAAASKKRVEEESFAPLTNMNNVTIGLNLNATYKTVLLENSLQTSYFYYAKFSRQNQFEFRPYVGIQADGSVKCTFASEDAKEFLGSQNKDNHFEDFAVTCGNELVTRVQEGGIFILKTSLVFKNTNDKKKFEASGNLNVNGDVAALNANAKKRSKETNVSATNKIEVKQFGGVPTKFFSFFPDTSCEEALQKSTTGKESECSKFLKDATNYLRNEFGSQFNKTDSEAFYTFGYQTTRLKVLDRILNIK